MLLLRHAEHLSYEEFRVVTRRWETLSDLDGAEHNDEASEARRKASVIEVGGAIDVRASGGSGLRSKRDELANVVDVRNDGTAMVPVGRRLYFDDSDDDRPGMDQDVIDQWDRRTIRVEFCRLRTSDVEFVGSYRPTPPA